MEIEGLALDSVHARQCSTLLLQEINTEILDAETKAANTPGEDVSFSVLYTANLHLFTVVMKFHWCLFGLLALLVVGLHAAELEGNEFPSCAVSKIRKCNSLSNADT